MAYTPKTHTINSLSLELGVDRVKLTKALAGVKPDEQVGKRDKWLIRTAHRVLSEGSGASKTAKEEAEGKYKDAKAKLVMMELEEKQGKLVKIEEVQRVLKAVLLATRTRFLAIPSRLASKMVTVKDPNKAKDLIKKAVNSALEEISTFDMGKISAKSKK